MTQTKRLQKVRQEIQDVWYDIRPDITGPAHDTVRLAFEHLSEVAGITLKENRFQEDPNA